MTTTQSATVGAQLAEAAKRAGDAIAVAEADARTTYRQLDEAATAVARRIVAASGGTGRTCLLFERKLPALQALFGAARAASPYVLLDAGDPAERLRFIAEDSEPAALVTEAALLERAHDIAPAGCPIIDIDDATAFGETRPLPDVRPDAPLYLCYTSGSTGRPKGVIQSHANLLFFAAAYAKALALRGTDRLSLLYALSFNAANMDVFGALLAGATLCAYDLRRAGTRELADWLDRERISVLHAVPTVFRELGRHLPPERVLPYLRVIDLGGETVFASDVDLFRAHTQPPCVFVNQLASTEVGLIAQHIVAHDSAQSASIIAAGRSPDGVHVSIRRDDGCAAAIGEAGEMIVSSPHVSPGYWRRPDLDAAVFTPDPDRPGWRRYASGDVGRIDASGRLHFLGRRGSRVKIRGHSVDLMEVEAALSACPGVLKAAVLALGGGETAQPERLVAFVTMREASERVPATIRRHLAARIPQYMLPARFAFVDALPLTASGKIDREALRGIDVPAEHAARDVEPPRDETEQAIAAVFERLLHVSPVGRGDDFFLLGGDSLLGIELQAELRTACGVRVASFHEDATVARIAEHVRGARAGGPAARDALPVLFPLWRQGSATPLFLVHGRHGQAFVSPHFMRLLGDDQPVWVFQARGLDGVQAPHASVDDMAAEYVAELRRQQPRGPYFLGALCAGAYVAAEMARALADAGEVVLPLLLLDPPERLAGGYAQLTEERFIRKMKERRAMGRSAGHADDPESMGALVRTALAFEQAVARHQPRRYDGAVYMLSSRQRMRDADPAEWRKIFTGKLKRFEVGTTHGEALDPRNPLFASYLLRCVALIREAARSAQAHRDNAAALPARRHPA